MEKLKKLFALVLAFALVMSVGVTAFADAVTLGKPKRTELNIKIEGAGKGSVTVSYGDGETFTVTDESDKKSGKLYFDKTTEVTVTVLPAEGYYVSKAEGVTKDETVLTMNGKNEEVKVTFSEKSKAKKTDALTAKTDCECIGNKVAFTVTASEHGNGWKAFEAEIFEVTADGDEKLGSAEFKDGKAVIEAPGKTEAGEGTYYAVLTYEHQNQPNEHKHYEYVLTNEAKAEWIGHDWDEGVLNEKGDKIVHSCKNEGCKETYETEYTAPNPNPNPNPVPKPETDSDKKDTATIVIGQKGDNKTDKTEKPEKNPSTGAPVFGAEMAAVVALISAITIIRKKH